MAQAGPGRPKELKGKLVNFNTKVEEDLKITVDAIIATGSYGSKREMLEDWTQKYLKADPEAADRVEEFKRIIKG